MNIKACRLCPRRCGASRGETGQGSCQSGSEMRIVRAALHHWEEPPISGTRGSGTVFFSGCALRCVTCQNHEISVGENRGKMVTPEELSAVFFSLVEQGAHNINLVTASHFAPMVRKALLWKKLPVPVVYNCGGYESVAALRTLEGLVDVYLPDFKYAEAELAGALSNAPDYPEIVLAALAEMVRQTGKNQMEDGLLKRGVLVRHLILPGHTRNSIAVLRLLKQRFPDVPVSLMAQFVPVTEADVSWAYASRFPELCRSITRRELAKVQDELFALGLDGFVQSRAASSAKYLPDFHQFEERR